MPCLLFIRLLLTKLDAPKAYFRSVLLCFSPFFIQSLKLMTFLLAPLFMCNSLLANNLNSTPPDNYLWLAIIVFVAFIAQVITFGRNKTLRQKISHTQRELEHKVDQRTQKLREINKRLYDVINQHESMRMQLIESK